MLFSLCGTVFTGSLGWWSTWGYFSVPSGSIGCWFSPSNAAVFFSPPQSSWFLTFNLRKRSSFQINASMLLTLKIYIYLEISILTPSVCQEFIRRGTCRSEKPFSLESKAATSPRRRWSRGIPHSWRPLELYSVAALRGDSQWTESFRDLNPWIWDMFSLFFYLEKPLFFL